MTVPTDFKSKHFQGFKRLICREFYAEHDSMLSFDVTTSTKTERGGKRKKIKLQICLQF